MAFYQYIADSGRKYEWFAYLPFVTGDVVDFTSLNGGIPPADGRWTSNAGPATVMPVVTAVGAVAVRNFGLAANIPQAAQLPDQYYFATDTQQLSFSDGVTWTATAGISQAFGDTRWLKLAGGTVTGGVTMSGADITLRDGGKAISDVAVSGAYTLLQGTADNGVTDNRPGFQAQLTALAARGGGLAILPAATSYYGVKSDVVVPGGVTLTGTQPYKLKNPGQAVPTAGNVVGSVLGPAAGGSFTLGVVQLTGTSACLERIGVFGNGDHTVAGMVDAPSAVYLGSLGSRLLRVLGWGGVLATADGSAGAAFQDTTITDSTFINGLNNLGTALTGVTISGGSATISNVPSGAFAWLQIGQSISIDKAVGDGTVDPWTYITALNSGAQTITLNQPINSNIGAGVTQNLLVGTNWITETSCYLTNNSTQLVLPNTAALAALQSLAYGGIGATVNGAAGPSGGAVVSAITPLGSQVATLSGAVTGTTVTTLPVTPASVTSPIPCQRLVLNDGSGHTLIVNSVNAQILGALSGTLSTGSPITSLPVSALPAAVGAGTITLTAAAGQTQSFTTTGAAAGATSIPITSATPNFAYPSGLTVTSTGVLPGSGQITILSISTAGITYPNGATVKTPDNVVTMSSTCFTNSNGTATIDFQTGHTLRIVNGGDNMYQSVRCLLGTTLVGGSDQQFSQCHFSNGSNLATFNVIATASKGAVFTSCILDSAVPSAALLRRDFGQVQLAGTIYLDGNTGNSVAPRTPTRFSALYDNGTDGKGFTVIGGSIPKLAQDGYGQFITFGSGSTPAATSVMGVDADAASVQADAPLAGWSANFYVGGLPGRSVAVKIGGVLQPESGTPAAGSTVSRSQYKLGAASVAVGLSGVDGAATTVSPDSGFVGIRLSAASWTTASVSGETITFTIVAHNSDATTSTYTKTATTNTTTQLAATDYITLAKDGVYITSVTMTAHTNLGSTAATVTAAIAGNNLT